MSVCSDKCEFLGRWRIIFVVVVVLTLVFAMSVEDVFKWHGEDLRRDLCPIYVANV